MARKRARLGDILQINTVKGFAYAQLTHRHQFLGCLIRILPGTAVSPLEPEQLASKVLEKELYHTFVFEDDLHAAPVVRIVGHAPIPNASREFPLFRDGVVNPRTKRVDTWWLWDGTKSWPIGKLNDEQQHLPVRAIWNYKILADRIGSGWLPEAEV